jgi:hypothetical protein
VQESDIVTKMDSALDIIPAGTYDMYSLVNVLKTGE